MVLKRFNPTAPSRRQMTMPTSEEVTTNALGKPLLVSLRETGGGNAQDKITIRHHGGGAKRKYRIIDFKRNRGGIPTKVTATEYDLDRLAYITLVVYADGGKGYILTPVGLKAGDTAVSGPEADIKPGNALQLKHMPVGTFVHNIKLQAGKDGQMVKSAGASAQLMAKEGGYATLGLSSGEMRYVRIECKATVGTVPNTAHETVNIDKAGRKRHTGWRPTIKGSIVNPCGHPHSDGEGKFPVGGPSPVTPWGKPALGCKTRKNKKYLDRLIIKRRNTKQFGEN